MGYQQQCTRIKERNSCPKSSPVQIPSKRLIEAMVKVVKNIMEKAEESGSDPHLAMLIYRATLIRPSQLSPGELLTHRKYRALLPIHAGICEHFDNNLFMMLIH